MRFLGHDIRAAARRLWQSPVYFAFSVVTLAVAIGSTTAVYSVIEAALFRQQPFPHIGEIVNIYQSDMRFGASGPMIYLSHHDLEDLQASQTTFASVAAWRRFVATAMSDGGSQRLLGEAVTGEYFDLLGVNAALGRMLQPADDQPQAPPVIVLSDGVWRRMFGADPLVVGKSLRFGGALFEIVGVAPAWFRGSDMPNLIPTPAWIPAASTRHFSETGLAVHELPRDSRAWIFKARLKPGATVEAARAEVTAISQRIGAADPRRQSQRSLGFGRRADDKAAGWYLLPLVDLRLHESMHVVAGPVASMLMGAVLLVLLVGCSNLANLTLARVARRQQEVAVRVALGASRLRIVREQLVESSIIAALGWGLGLLLARGLMNVFGQSIEMHAAISITLQLQPAFNVPVLAASLAATALSVVVVGLGPAIRQSRGDVRSAIASAGAGPVAPR
ncbi:MAG: ABC transporter permease, partial [Acidobacteriota bacterium]